MLLNILIPISLNGEHAATEHNFSIFPREKMTDEEFKTAWTKFCDPKQGIRLTFNQDEAKELYCQAQFSEKYPIQDDIILATAVSIYDIEGPIIEIIGRFQSSTRPSGLKAMSIGKITHESLTGFFKHLAIKK